MRCIRVDAVSELSDGAILGGRWSEADAASLHCPPPLSPGPNATGAAMCFGLWRKWGAARAQAQRWRPS